MTLNQTNEVTEPYNSVHKHNNEADDRVISKPQKTMTAIEEIKEQLAGVWVLKTNENLEAYLQEIGVGFVMRKIALAANSTMTIAIEGQKIRISTNRPKDSQAFFALGKEFDSKDPQDNQFKAVATWKDGVLTTQARPVDEFMGIPHLIERRIVDGDLEMKITVNNVVCKRIFKKKPT